ncbi:MAG: YidC/Oxa1 family rane protein insertase [Pseudonocardiales bacterium]|jgi:YidC/Oxa1 family membrane protein insertase|nr:YidC/Oxa1 family rane protein insertase [Pseudonocardiales bacterium]
MLDPLYTAVSWVLLRWYQLFTLLGMDKQGGLTWALSIIMLVVTARLLLFRFFVKQVHYQRRMQEMQPKIKKLQEKHKGDKATLQREMMSLQQSEGFNPISGCLPMFLQIPIFIALFHVLKHMSNSIGLAVDSGARGLTLYGFTAQQTFDASHAKLFNAPLAASLHESSTKILGMGGDVSATRAVTIILVIVSAAATFITQRAVISNAPTPAEGQAAMIQKLMLVGIPISVVFSGFIFPLGVLLYWFTSNLWTMGQQFYIFRFHPHPSSATAGPAEPQNEVGRSLAPKVGAKPVNPKNNRTNPKATNLPDDGAGMSLDGADGGLPDDTVTAPPDKAVGGSASRPSNRSPRSTANRPANKRSPSKKRR